MGGKDYPSHAAAEARAGAGKLKIVLPHNDVSDDVSQRRRLIVVSWRWGDAAMIDFSAKLEQFETLAAECELIAKLATERGKRELYLRLALHYSELAADLRKIVAAKDAA